MKNTFYLTRSEFKQNWQETYKHAENIYQIGNCFVFRKCGYFTSSVKFKMNSWILYHYANKFYSVADPGFPRLAPSPKVDVKSYYLANCFPKTAWNWKNLDSLDPPMLLSFTKLSFLKVSVLGKWWLWLAHSQKTWSYDCKTERRAPLLDQTVDPLTRKYKRSTSAVNTHVSFNGTLWVKRETSQKQVIVLLPDLMEVNFPGEEFSWSCL